MVRNRALISAFGMLSVLIASLQAQAQDRKNFETYGEALSSLLDLSQSSNSGTTPVPDRNVTCALFGDAISNDNVTNIASVQSQYDQLSSALQAHCHDTLGNSSSGAALGGGFGSTLTTRTVSQFDEQIGTDQGDNQNQTGDERFNFGRGLELNFDNESTFGLRDVLDIYASTQNRYSLSEQAPTGTVRWSSDDTAVFFTYEHEEIDRAATKYQDGLESSTDRFVGGATFRLNKSLAIGALGFYGEGDGEYDGAGSALTGAPFDIGNYTYEQICGIKNGGDEKHHEYGGSLFGAYTQPDWFVTNEMTAEKFKSKSTNSLCLAQTNEPNDSFPDPIRRVYRGLINGEPDGYSLREKLIFGRRYDFGILSISPRLGGDVAWTKINSYEETETDVTGAPTPPLLAPEENDDPNIPTDPNDPRRLVNQTGAALAYEDQEYISVRSRVGFVASAVLGSDIVAIVPFGEAYYIHEFANDQEKIEAHFVGDNREDPRNFTFKTNKPDRNYFEVATGFTLATASLPVELSVGFRTIVGNDVYDYYQFEGGLRVPF